jgi:hypothetical protein
MVTRMNAGTHRHLGLLLRLVPCSAIAFVFSFSAIAEAQTPAVPLKKVADLLQTQEPPVIFSSVRSSIRPENLSIHISLTRQRAWVWVGDELYLDSPISSGKRTGSTPKGQFLITEKDIDHRSSVYGDYVSVGSGKVVRSGVSRRIDGAPARTRFLGAPMKYFMRLTDDGVGMHVGKLPGYPASHGCVRLPEVVAKAIFEVAQKGTPVEITD